MRLSFKRSWAAGLAAAALAAGAAHAQDEGTQLSVELNSLQTSESGCRLTFVAENRLGPDLSRVAFEVALFNAEGLVERMTVVDFRDLPANATRVRQFEFKDVSCDGIGRVLINGVADCAGDAIEPGACLQHLQTTSKSSVAFGS